MMPNWAGQQSAEDARGRFVEGVIGVVVLVVGGALLIGLGVPLARRRVPRNRWYGFRLGAALRDDEIWYAVNERSGRHLVILGLALMALGLGGLALRGNERGQWILLIVAAALIMFGMVHSLRICLGLARQLEHGRDPAHRW